MKQPINKKILWLAVIVCVLFTISYIGFAYYNASQCECGGLLNKECKTGYCIEPICDGGKVCGICSPEQDAAQAITMEVQDCD